MAKDKDRAINPAQAQRKLEKQKAVKKGKAEALARRNEKLGRRNPERIQRQIDELKSLEAAGEPLKPRDKKLLEDLERDVAAVRKARVALGDKAPTFGRDRRHEAKSGGPRGPNSSVLGKRGRDGHSRWDDSGSSETDEDVRNIPMPRDTPPPIPQGRGRHRGPNTSTPSNDTRSHPLPPKPELQAKAVYESAPVVRNLRQEAVSKFVPAAVRKKQEAIKGQGRLMEPDEVDRLEKEGYGGTHTGGNNAPRPSPQENDPNSMPLAIGVVPKPTVNDQKLAEEEASFERELKHVSIEEVEDEDG